MRYRARALNGIVKKTTYLTQDGVIFRDGLVGLERKNFKVEFLVGKDSLGNDVYENDVLVGDYSTYTAGFDLDFGAYLESKNGGKIPFKQCVEKLVLRSNDEN